MLALTDAPAAVTWYEKALGAIVLWNLGSVAGLEINEAAFLLVNQLILDGRVLKNSVSLQQGSKCFVKIPIHLLRVLCRQAPTAALIK
jgi:hypothetical protein